MVEVKKRRKSREFDSSFLQSKKERDKAGIVKEVQARGPAGVRGGCRLGN